MIVIIHPDVDIWNFVLSCLEGNSDVHLFPLNRHCNYLQQGIRKIAKTTSAHPFLVLGSSIRQSISQLSSGDKVVLCEYTESSLVSSIAQIVPQGVTCHLWLWDHKRQSSIFYRQLQVARNYGFSVSSYEEEDAAKYGLKWHPQFFCLRHIQELFRQEVSPEFDFYFVGYCKNRQFEIEQILEQLNDFESIFHTVHKSSEYISYSQYLTQAQKSRCIVEIVHKGEKACTLRPLEAIALKRKLLTNNPEIKKYSFYHPQNIFILGQDDFSSLSAFIQSPFVPLPEETVDSYDINHWLCSFQ